VELSGKMSSLFEITNTEKALSEFVIWVNHRPRILLGVTLRLLWLVIYQPFSLVFLLDRFLVGLLEVLFTIISFSCCFEMTEEGFLRACLPAVGGVKLLFLASFSSCSFEMAEGFSRDFLPAIRGVEILFSASFFPCRFEMAEGFSRAFLPSGVSPGPIAED
jgi:hypothetical protein